MQFKPFFTVVSLALVSVVQGVAIAPRAALDVWAPKIIKPDADTVWKVGTLQSVTWDTSDAPEQISNGAAVELFNEARTNSTWLAKGFDLRAGCVEVKVPAVDPGKFSITLFGDSGDMSALFKIVH